MKRGQHEGEHEGAAREGGQHEGGSMRGAA